MNEIGDLIDITRPMYAGMPVWPGDSPFRFSAARERAAEDVVTTGSVSMGLHTGTHVDAPRHVREVASSVDGMDPEVFVGSALVIDTRPADTIGIDVVRRLLQEWPLPERVLFRTGAWGAGNRFPKAFAAIASDAADALVAAGVRLVGTDAPSVDPLLSTDLQAHQRLLSAGIPILENLLLDHVPEGRYLLIALPLKIVGGDASPVRAVLRPYGG